MVFPDGRVFPLGPGEMIVVGDPVTSLHNSNIPRRNRRFLQPLAVALVFLVFGLLFFSMAMMDLQRLKGLFLDALKKKALYVAEVIEKSASEKYSRLVRDGNANRSLTGGLAMVQEDFSLQEALAGTLIDVAAYIDSMGPLEAVVRERIQNLAASENFRSIALLDDKGRVVYETSPLSPAAAACAKPLAEGKEEIAITLFNGLCNEEYTGLVGIRRQGGKGAVLLALDWKGLEFWLWRIAIRAAVEEELRWGEEVVYLAVENPAGQTLVRSGSVLEEKVEECLLLIGDPVGGERNAEQCLKAGDTKFLRLTFPFHFDGAAIGTTQVGIRTHETDRLLIENRRHIFFWAGFMVTIGLLAMVGLYQWQNRHIAKLQAIQDQLHHAERLSSLGKLGAGVAHEIRNPLNAISMAAQRLQREFAPPGPAAKEEFTGISHVIRDEVRRLNDIVEDFLSLTQNNRKEFQEQSLAHVLDRVFFLTREEAGAKGIVIEKRWGPDVPKVFMNPGKMEQALLNIVRNAVESISGEGRVTISCERMGKKWVNIRIQDTGTGIPPMEEARIFDPFYSTKKNGVGLGLAITHEIILAHGGEIRVESLPETGTMFEVRLPRQNQGKS